MFNYELNNNPETEFTLTQQTFNRLEKNVNFIQIYCFIIVDCTFCTYFLNFANA